MDANIVRAADAQARKRFTYRPEPGDTWRSNADKVLKDEPWKGDCDDLASTVLDLLTRDGADLSDCYRLMVASDNSKTPDHLIACVRCADGSFFIVGDTFRSIYPAAALRHRGLFYNRLSEAAPDAIWREGTPWK